LTKISAIELYQRLQQKNNVTIIDVRAEEKFQDYHIGKSRNIPKTLIFNLNEGEEDLALPKDQELIIACTTGNSAAKCADILNEHGYKTVVLDGGLTAWKEFLQSK
jgi:rhodanese-related sulfurtransferase